MDEIDLDRLEAGHLRRYSRLYAATSGGDAVPVWDSNRLPPFVSRDSEGTLMEEAAILVRSLDAADLEPVYARITSLDPIGAKRLVREPKPPG